MGNHYHTLGLIPGVENAVVIAAYRALAQLYHPDKTDDPAAASKMQAINEAYEVLSDPARRTEYDASLDADDTDTEDSYFDDTAPFEEDILATDWAIAVEYHPEIERLRRRLGHISWRLDFGFRLLLLETKRFVEARSIAQDMEAEYLTRHFGSDPLIREFGRQLIVYRELSAAHYLNRALSILGDSVSDSIVKAKVFQKFAGLSTRFEVKQILEQWHTIKRLNPIRVERLAHLHGGRVELIGMFRVRHRLTLDGSAVEFQHMDELAQHLIAKYSELYGMDPDDYAS